MLLRKKKDQVDKPRKKTDKGAKHRPPKGWFTKMKKEIKKNDPSYSEEALGGIIGEIWFNNLSDAKREEIYKRHGKDESPNK